MFLSKNRLQHNDIINRRIKLRVVLLGAEFRRPAGRRGRVFDLHDVKFCGVGALKRLKDVLIEICSEATNPELPTLNNEP